MYAWANVTLAENDVVTVDESDYLLNILALIDRTPKRVVQNYVTARFFLRQQNGMQSIAQIDRDILSYHLRGISQKARKIHLWWYGHGQYEICCVHAVHERTL